MGHGCEAAHVMVTKRMTAEARRAAILEAATDVFGRLGFETTRMEDVAKAAGVAKGLLYKHFASKDALFEALLREQGDAYVDGLRSTLTSADISGDPVTALSSGLSGWFRQLTVEGFNFTDPGVHDAYDALRERIREVIADAFAVAAPESDRPQLLLAAALVQGAAESFGLAWRADHAGLSEDDALAMLATFCWGGLSLLQSGT